MKLLVFTQAVDLDDPVLGFFHRWLEEISKRFERVHVVCLKEGRHTLPPHVHVHSLGKESGSSKFTRIFRVYRYLFSLWNEYDAVFVHMNQEYVLLGGVFWRLLGKRVVLWRNHKMGNTLTSIACGLSNAVCYTSPDAFVAAKKNALKMPIGIDTSRFSPGASAPSDSLLFLGRIDIVKNPLVFIDALSLLKEQGIAYRADVYGDPTYADDPHFARFKEKVDSLIQSRHVFLYPSVRNDQTPDIYRAHAIYVNLTPSGSFDKTIGEALASGCVVVCANEVVRGVIPDQLLVKVDAESTAAALQHALALTENERSHIIATSRSHMEKEHSLSLLVERLVGILNA